MKKAEEFEPISGQLYEFCNAPYLIWSEPRYYIGRVPWNTGEYNFITISTEQGHTTEWYRYVRPILSERIKIRLSSICPDKIDEIIAAMELDNKPKQSLPGSGGDKK